jgi:hypothetical protein
MKALKAALGKKNQVHNQGPRRAAAPKGNVSDLKFFSEKAKKRQG